MKQVDYSYSIRGSDMQFVRWDAPVVLDDESERLTEKGRVRPVDRSDIVKEYVDENG